MKLKNKNDIKQSNVIHSTIYIKNSKFSHYAIKYNQKPRDFNEAT